MSCMRASLIYKYWKHSKNTHIILFTGRFFTVCRVVVIPPFSIAVWIPETSHRDRKNEKSERERWSLRIFPRLFLWYVLHGYTILHLNTKLLWNKCNLNKNSTRHKIKQHERKKILLCLSSFSSRRKKEEAREIEQKDDNKNVDFTFC